MNLKSHFNFSPISFFSKYLKYRERLSSPYFPKQSLSSFSRSKIFNNNSFYLNDRFGFNSINFYTETDVQICKCGLKNQISNSEIPTIIVKKQGIFETFFNFFSK